MNFLDTGMAAVYVCQRCKGMRSRYSTVKKEAQSDNGLMVGDTKLCVCAEPMIPEEKEAGKK